MAIRVSKWYVDLVAPNGEAAIGYAARIRWGRLKLNYSASLRLDPAGDVTERMSLRGFREPAWRGQTFAWESRPLRLSAQWKPLRPATKTERKGEILLGTPRGDVAWHLLSGRAEGTWTQAGKPLHGVGYIERLDITLPPWELPIDELYWGRFVSDIGHGEDDAAWIEWRGPHPLRLVWRRGELVTEEAAPAFDDQQAPGELGLALTDPVTLRDGALVTTVFSKIPVLRRVLPTRMLGARETKWRSRGEMQTGAKGWAIHEVVRWS